MSVKRPKVIALRNLIVSPQLSPQIPVDLGKFATVPQGKQVLVGNAGPVWAERIKAPKPTKPGSVEEPLRGAPRLSLDYWGPPLTGELNGGGHRFAIGIRNAHDKSMRLAMTVGYRVMVCENMAFNGNFEPVLAKHTKK